MLIASRMSLQQIQIDLGPSSQSEFETKSSANGSRSLFETILSQDVYEAVAANILDRISNPNDLVALVRCSSTLHDQVIPYIYHHFNIIWDTTAKAEDKCALALGVCTLAKFQPNRCANSKPPHGTGSQITLNGRDRKRWRNTYAAYVRKFSIANGPENIAKKYLATNITGLQLNALIATALAHMRCLECFAWDLPTGIAVEVWSALSSLVDSSNGSSAPLDKIWVRLPQNLSTEHGLPAQPYTTHIRSFSLMGPLKSLSVLDIDSSFCLDEIAYAIQKSWGVLRELRIGISHHARPNFPHDALERLFRGAWQMHSQQRQTSFDKRHLRRERSIQSSGVARASDTMHKLRDEEEKQRSRSVGCVQNAKLKHSCWTGEVRNVLRLDILELERIRISARVLRTVVDWTSLTRLTLLGCTSTERLWKCLCASVVSCGHDYSRFNLKRIHVDELSSSLVRFLTDSLKRNTLEAFFLQEQLQVPGGSRKGNVEGALWSHRLSLRKIMIGRLFSIKELDLFNRRNMPALREIGFDLVYGDWGEFCYKMPHLAHLHAVSIGDFREPGHDWLIAPREVANEFAGMIAWRIGRRPEIGLSYISIGDYCFQLRDRANVIRDKAVGGDHAHLTLKSCAQRHCLRSEALCSIEVREIHFYERVEIFRIRHAQLTFSPAVDV